MIRTSYDKGISSRIIISPSHARIWEVIHAGGLWDTWENWKRALVTIVEQEADSAGKPAYEVWDFSGYNAITTEPVSGTTGPMRWYWDGSHFKQAAGRLILSKMFGASAPDVPDRFGAVLNSQNIDAHLSAVREAREMYLIAHPQYAKEAARWSELNK